MRNNECTISSPVKIMMSARVVMPAEQISEDEHSHSTFQWSCRPLLNWFYFLGIPLQLDETRNGKVSHTSTAHYYCKWFIACFGIFMFLSNLARLVVYITLNFFSLYSATNVTDSVLYRKQMSSTTIWNDFLDYFNEFFISLGSQLILLASTLVHWKDLKAVLNRIEDQNIFTLKTLRRFRRVFLYGLSIVILVNYFNLQ